MDAYVIRAIRDKYGWTQEEFAGKLRLSTSHIGSVEAGIKKVGSTMRFRISQVCDITPEILEMAARARRLDKLFQEK
ncbi:Helix-turn-helix domain protein [compost metagenome]